MSVCVLDWARVFVCVCYYTGDGPSSPPQETSTKTTSNTICHHHPWHTCARAPPCLVRNDRRSAHPSHYSQDGWCSRSVRPRCCCLEAPLYILEGSLSRPLRSISLRCQTHLFQLSWPKRLTAFIACHLVTLTKCPGVRPIGIGETPRRIIGKVIANALSDDIQSAPGPLHVGTLRIRLAVRQICMRCANYSQPQRQQL